MGFVAMEHWKRTSKPKTAGEGTRRIMTEEEKTETSEKAADGVRRVRRTKRIRVQHASEIGALVRLARRRLGMSQTDAAICCGVGRRFLVELENGKPTVQLDRVLVVLDALGIGLTVGGPGVSFTAEELAQATVKREPGEAAHVWEAEFVTGVETPGVLDDSDKPHRGRTPGSIALKYRRMSSVKDEDGSMLFETTEEEPPAPKREERIEVNLRQAKRRAKPAEPAQKAPAEVQEEPAAASGADGESN